MSDIDELTEQLESLAANERSAGHFADARFTTEVKDALTEQAAEIERLREALEPFSDAYEKTKEAIGYPPERYSTTANCVSQPYIKMADYVAAFAALTKEPTQ